MDERGLVGLWSVDQRFAPGAMCDDYLAFLPDGRGWFERAVPLWSRVEAFRWTVGEDGTLTISGTASFEVQFVGGVEQVAEGAGLLHVEGLNFRVEREGTPRGDEMDVLTIDEGGGRWRNCLEWMGAVNEKYGRIHRDFEGYEPPACLKCRNRPTAPRRPI